MLPTLERINALFTYERETGKLFWNYRPLADFKNVRAHNTWNGKLAGKEAGSISDGGYRVIGFDGMIIKAHRIVWFIEKGEWPLVTDHDNGIRNDNRLSNLLNGDHSSNMKNKSLHKTNKSGYPGVIWEKSKSLWVARIPVDGKLKTLGRSKDKSVVIALRQKAEAELGYNINHGRAA